MKNFKVFEADLSDNVESANVLELLSTYATDIMGGGIDLSSDVKRNLIPELKKRSGVYVFLAYAESEAIGLAICFEGFSTFYAKPLINIHDFVVVKSYRGQGVAKLLLEKIEQRAVAIGACKLTLEVLEGNKRAQSIYKAFGFAGYELDDSMGKAMFMDKKL